MRSAHACVLAVQKPFTSLGIATRFIHMPFPSLTFVCKKGFVIHPLLHKFSTQFSTSLSRILHLLVGRFCTVYTAPIISISWVKKSIHYLVGFSLEGGLS